MIYALQEGTNAEVIERIAPLWIPKTAKVMDPTYGRGLWWTRFRPDDLTAHDLIVDGVNFLALPEAPCTYDVVTFDPPYIAPGGRKTSTIPGFNSAYGLGYTPKTPRQLQNDLINPGLTECARVVRKGGVILVKCMAYISSGDLQNGPKWTIDHAESIGLRQVDEFVHLGTEGPQPAHKRQVHARRTYSTLLVFRKPKRG